MSLTESEITAILRAKYPRPNAEKHARYRAKHADAIRASNAAYRARNRDAIRVRNAQFEREKYQADPAYRERMRAKGWLKQNGSVTPPRPLNREGSE